MDVPKISVDLVFRDILGKKPVGRVDPQLVRQAFELALHLTVQMRDIFRDWHEREGAFVLGVVKVNFKAFDVSNDAVGSMTVKTVFTTWPSLEGKVTFDPEFEVRLLEGGVLKPMTSKERTRIKNQFFVESRKWRGHVSAAVQVAKKDHERMLEAITDASLGIARTQAAAE